MLLHGEGALLPALVRPRPHPLEYGPGPARGRLHEVSHISSLAGPDGVLAGDGPHPGPGQRDGHGHVMVRRDPLAGHIDLDCGGNKR